MAIKLVPQVKILKRRLQSFGPTYIQWAVEVTIDDLSFYPTFNSVGGAWHRDEVECRQRAQRIADALGGEIIEESVA